MLLLRLLPLLSLLIIPTHSHNSTVVPGDTSAADGTEDAGDSVRIDRRVYEVVGALGLVVNTLLLLVLARKGGILGRIPRMFVCNQSSIDLLSSIFIIIHQHYGFAISDKLPEAVPHPGAYCKFFWSTYILWSLLSASTANLMLLTIERYLSICHTTWHHNHISERKIIIGLFFAWIIGFAEMQFLTQFTYMEDDVVPTCVYVARSDGIEIFQGTYNFIWMFAVPVFVLVFGYGSIVMQLRRQRKVKGNPAAVGDAVPAQSQVSEVKRRREQSMTYTFCAIGVAYVVCLGPNQVTWYQFMLGGPLYPEHMWYPLTVGLSFTNCCVNPIIYLLRLRSLRRALVSMLTCGKPAGDGASTAVSTTGNGQQQM